MKAKIRTQKAHGLHYLKTQTPYGDHVPPFVLCQDGRDVDRTFLPFERTFARPCPVTPRHGFVDSQEVEDVRQARTVFAHAKRKDRGAELLLMPYVDAPLSAVLTPSAVSVGMGHDGVTGSGRDVITFPLAHVDFSWLDKAKARIQNSPYVESVQARKYNAETGKHKVRTHVVQLRDGPAVPTVNADAFIPDDMTVKRVLWAEGDLLEWEQKMRDAKPGTVVYHPGGSMLSHYAVHAVLNRVPVIFTHNMPPMEGEVLRSNAKTPEVNYSAVERGLSYAMRNQSPHYALDMANLPIKRAAVVAHQVTALAGTADGCTAIGLGVAYLLRCAVGACNAEARHVGLRVKGERVGRSGHYAIAMQNYAQARLMLPEAHKLFSSGDWNTGYGGKRWAGISGAACALDTATLRFMRNPDASTYTAMISATHTLLNTVHNGSTWMTKFASPNDLDDAARGDLHVILTAAYELHKDVKAARATYPQMWADQELPECASAFLTEPGHWAVRISHPQYIAGMTDARYIAFGYTDGAHVAWRHDAVDNHAWRKMARQFEGLQPMPGFESVPDGFTSEDWGAPFRMTADQIRVLCQHLLTLALHAKARYFHEKGIE